MWNISSCQISLVIALALIGGTFFTCTVSRAEHEKLKKVFSPELDERYSRIVRERRNHYLQGLGLGAVLAWIWMYLYPPAHRIVVFFAITMVVGMLYYRLMPKSDYMLNHLQTAEQNRAWLEMYKTMQSRYILGMLFGALAALALANAICAQE